MRPLIVISLCALMACKGKEEAPPAAKPAEPAMVPETTEMPAPGTTASGINLSKLSGQLKSESSSRPNIPITVEKVWAALDGAGVPVDRKKQILGLTVAANYCADARTADKIVVVVCEYPDPKSAEEAKKRTEEKFGKMSPNAIRRVNGATVLTIVSGGNVTQSPNIDKIVSTFTALKSSGS